MAKNQKLILAHYLPVKTRQTGGQLKAGLGATKPALKSKYINKRKGKMANIANSKQTNSNNKPKADLPKVNLATRVKNTLGKTTLEVTSPLVLIAGIVVSGLVGAVVAQRVLSVVESSNCGASVNFKSSPSSLLDFQLKKEACNKSPETAAK
ncbi:hypothetical protein [Nostoc sp. FACHB-888]|uniref:hypothetical protein n=1 Tax=Nostoc sp. FACHB-888 TaxID=2692842 RepID=UPI001F54E5DB|nr:hypothetical protein [Nostoc sp. FACHB-888]